MKCVAQGKMQFFPEAGWLVPEVTSWLALRRPLIPVTVPRNTVPAPCWLVQGTRLTPSELV